MTGGAAQAFAPHEAKLNIEVNMQTVDHVKWLATAVQLVGYGLTGMGITPWNIYLFFAGILLWFAVGVMWKDQAIKLVHIGAFISLLDGCPSADQTFCFC